MNDLKVCQEDNIIKIKDNNVIILEIVSTGNGLTINYKGNLTFNFDGDIETNINGEYSVVSKGMFIDTIEKLYLNSKMAKQIRDLPDSIEYRKRQEKICNDNLEKAELEGPKKYIGSNE